jgi:hypothetical protein
VRRKKEKRAEEEFSALFLLAHFAFLPASDRYKERCKKITDSIQNPTLTLSGRDSFFQSKTVHP